MINIDELTIGEAREIARLVNGTTPSATANGAHPAIGKYCIIRTYSAGVHAGIVTAIDGQSVSLKDASRIWSWSGAFTLSKVATEGPKKDGTRVTAVPEIFVTQAVEIIPATEAARKKIEACHE